MTSRRRVTIAKQAEATATDGSYEVDWSVVKILNPPAFFISRTLMGGLGHKQCVLDVDGPVFKQKNADVRNTDMTSRNRQGLAITAATFRSVWWRALYASRGMVSKTAPLQAQRSPPVGQMGGLASLRAQRVVPVQPKGMRALEPQELVACTTFATPLLWRPE